MCYKLVRSDFLMYPSGVFIFIYNYELILELNPKSDLISFIITIIGIKLIALKFKRPLDKTRPLADKFSTILKNKKKLDINRSCHIPKFSLVRHVAC